VRPDELEVVLVIDADDRESLESRFAALRVQQVVVEPGQTMGALNGAGYRASTGAYLMLLNDDVVARTVGWDEKVLASFRSFPDDIVLVHVNDTLLREALCTFPIVSRAFCELTGGICPADYVRYRIDDHIEDIFNLLGVLGERRTVYLPDVVFEHLNAAEQPWGAIEYHSDAQVLAVDAPRFDALAPERKELAVRLKQFIMDRARERQQQRWRSRLESIQDPFALRVPSRLRVEPLSAGHSSARPSVTIGLLTPDSRGKLFRTCLKGIQANTTNYELIVLEKRNAAELQLAREINRLLELARTDYLVVMEDNTLVRPSWLEGFLSRTRPNVGLVSLTDSIAGIPLAPGTSAAPKALTVGHLPLLLDTAKCRRLFFDEAYRTLICLADFGMRVWEAGFEVAAVSPELIEQRRPAARPLGDVPSDEDWDRDRERFLTRWRDTTRLQAWIDLDAGARSALLNQYLDAIVAQERCRPAWRESHLARCRRFLTEGLQRARSCLRRKGYRGLAQAIWNRFRRNDTAMQRTMDAARQPS
jgi:hypothetical protein